MTYTFFCGLTTEPNDDHFLIVGYEINRGIPMGFCLPAEDRDTIQWGHVIEVNRTGLSLIPVMRNLERQA